MAARKPTDNDVEIVRLNERSKQFRWFLGLAFAAFCVWQIRIAYSTYLASRPDTEAWERITAQVITGLLCLLAPTGVCALLWKHIRNFTRRTVSRLTRLESEVDPGRTSSELRPDGTDEPGTTP